jgi:hypothetical protein
MAGFMCKCGTTIRTSGAMPHPLQWMLISDEDFDTLTTAGVEAIYTAATTAFKCESCGRLWVYWNGFDSEPRCHTPVD